MHDLCCEFHRSCKNTTREHHPIIVIPEIKSNEMSKSDADERHCNKTAQQQATNNNIPLTVLEFDNRTAAEIIYEEIQKQPTQDKLTT